MPRDLSGNMTLPAGNPVVTGTAISSTVMNNTLADLAAEIQDSLSRSGKGGMTGSFKNADGTEAAPGITYTNETGTGWYRYAAGVVRMSILGAWRFAYSAAGMVIKGTLGLMDQGGTNKTVTLAPPTGLAADYTLTMPTALPASTLPVTVTSAGALAASTSLTMTAASGVAITVTGGAGGNAIQATGGSGASGVIAAGGSSSGTGIQATGGATNGIGGVFNGTGSGAAVSAVAAGSGAGVAAVSNSGYGGQFTGNVTKAPLRVVPQSATPSSPQAGDIYFDSDAGGSLQVYDGAVWRVITWT